MEERQSIECWVYISTPSGVRFLLLKTPPRTGVASFWQPITGGIEEGESATQACQREVKEETGLQLEDLVQLPFSQIVLVDNGSKKIHKHLFVGKAPCDTVRISDEHLESTWHDIENIRELLYWDTSCEAFQQIVDYLLDK